MWRPCVAAMLVAVVLGGLVDVLIQETLENRYDVIVGGITITPERRTVLNDSSPFMTTTLSLIVAASRGAALRTLADLKAETVGVQAATTDLTAAQRLLRGGEIGGITVYPFAEIGRALDDLVAGTIGAVMKVYPVADHLVRHHPGLKMLAQVPDDPRPLGFGFNKTNVALLAAVDEAIRRMPEDGTYQQIYRKWFRSGRLER